MTEYTDKRNRHVRTLRTLLNRERRWQVGDECEDRAEAVAALTFAVQSLDGLPEHWRIDDIDN